MSKSSHRKSSKKIVRGKGAVMSSVAGLQEAVETDIEVLLSKDLDTIMRSALFGFVIGGVTVATALTYKKWWPRFEKDSEFGDLIVKQLEDLAKLKARARKISKDNEMFNLFISGNLLKQIEFEEEKKGKEEFTWLDIADVEPDKYVLVFSLLRNLDILRNMMSSEEGFKDPISLDIIYDYIEVEKYYTVEDNEKLVAHLVKLLQSMENIHNSLLSGMALTYQQSSMLIRRLDRMMSIFTPEVLQSIPENFTLFSRIMEVVPIIEQYLVKKLGGSLIRTASVSKIRSVVKK